MKSATCRSSQQLPISRPLKVFARSVSWRTERGRKMLDTDSVPASSLPRNSYGWFRAPRQLPCPGARFSPGPKLANTASFAIAQTETARGRTLLLVNRATPPVVLSTNLTATSNGEKPCQRETNTLKRSNFNWMN